MMMKKIYLNRYITEGAKVFVGREKGKKVRSDSKIDELIQQDKVAIIIPRDIKSINPSFLEEFIKDSVLELGVEEFMNKVHFESEGTYDIKNDLKESIDRIIRRKNALG